MKTVQSLLICIVVFVLLPACATMAPVEDQPPLDIKLQIESTTPVTVTEPDQVTRETDITGAGLRYASMSTLTEMIDGTAHMRIWAGISVSDTIKVSKDLKLLEASGIRDIQLFISSPGGDAFQGLALADLIEATVKKGFNITAYSTGVVASAAVPIFAACSYRIASPGTIFMVHEAALWKWPGRESASDIRAQNRLMELLQDRYLGHLARRSALSREQWEEKEGETTWFTATQALNWGLVDEVQ